MRAFTRLSGTAVLSTCAAAMRHSSKYAPFDITDPMRLNDLLTPEERQVQETVRAYAQKELAKRVLNANRTESADKEIFRELGSLGVLGATLTGYGCSGVSYVASGMISRELEAVDSAYRTLWSVQSSLVMVPLHTFGSEEQKQRFLPKLATGEMIGCFGLTEPDVGSDTAKIATSAKKTEGGYILNGVKRWVEAGPLADIALVWAKEESSGKVRGFIVERGFKGFETPKIDGKLSFRAGCTGCIHLNNCFVPEANLLPGVVGLRGALECLSSARLGISWGVVGAAETCFRVAREYTMERKQFGRPLAATQLVQTKLADMLVDITCMQLTAFRLSKLKDEGNLSAEAISIGKRKNCGTALQIARTARDMLGANGIVDEYNVMRHACNLETVNTYEGTYDVHGLILGRAITGHNAF